MDIFKPAARELRDIETFAQSLTAICGRFRVSASNSSDPIDSHLSLQRSGSLDVANVGLDARCVERSSIDIQRDPGEHFFLILQREGCAHLSQGGNCAWVKPGDMFLVDATQPSQFNYTGDYSLQLSVHLPREEMLCRFGRRMVGGQKIDRLDPLGLSMRALLVKLCADIDTEQAHVVEAFYSVFGALLTDRAKQTNTGTNPDRAITQRALSIIADKFSDPSFTTTHLAELTGVSLRRMQRAFRIIEKTPHERLQSYRIEAAQSLLRKRQPPSIKPTITSIAHDTGFADLSTFYRLYRKTYGHPPGQTGNKRPFA